MKGDQFKEMGFVKGQGANINKVKSEEINAGGIRIHSNSKKGAFNMYKKEAFV